MDQASRKGFVGLGGAEGHKEQFWSCHLASEPSASTSRSFWWRTCPLMGRSRHSISSIWLP